MENNENGIKKWLNDNSWSLLITFAFVVSAFAYNTAEIKTARAEIFQVREQLDKYPSEQYFDLKFKTQDEKLTTLEKKIDDINAALNKHLQEK